MNFIDKEQNKAEVNVSQTDALQMSSALNPINLQRHIWLEIIQLKSILLEALGYILILETLNSHILLSHLFCLNMDWLM